MINTTPVVTIATLLTLLFTNGIVIANTINLNAAKDNTLYESFNGLLSNGAGTGLFAGRTQQGFEEIRRGLIMFDVAAQLPSSATITSATLTMNVSIVASSLGESIQLRRVATDWGEAGSIAGDGGGGGANALPGDVTWTHSFSPSTSWTNSGGDYSGVVSASQSVGDTGSYAWTSQQLADDIQDMLDTPNGNFGWIVLGNESFSQTAKRFDSRESTNPPVLTIEFNVPGGSIADFDGDGDVDGDDLDDWQTAYGQDNGGDADQDNDSDGTDFLVWQREHTSPDGLQTATVPEPTSASLALAFFALSALNRRHRVWRS